MVRIALAFGAHKKGLEEAVFPRRYLMTGALALAVLAAAATGLAAQCPTDGLPAKADKPGGFPSRALTMVVPYGPGGGSGQMALALAKAVTVLTGVAINRDHKPGGSGTAGMTAYMKAPADGYAILAHTDDAASAHALDLKRPNPAVDLVPLMTAQITFSQIYIRADETRYGDWKSFVDWVKTQDGKATIANASREGSMERVTMKQIANAAGMKIRPVSFDKSGPRYSALAGGKVDALFEQPGDVRSFLDKKKFKPILSISKERLAAFADVPSLADADLAIEPLRRFRGFYVGKGVSRDRLQWLQWALQKAFCEDGFRTFNERQFMKPADSFRDTAGSIALITKAIGRYRAIYKEMGLKPKGR